jgi:hypothetical protein
MIFGRLGQQVGKPGLPGKRTGAIVRKNASTDKESMAPVSRAVAQKWT